MSRFFIRVGITISLFSLLLSVNPLMSNTSGGSIAGAQAGSCVLIGDPITLGETEFCIETMAMIGCNCVWEWGIPYCQETHFCLYRSCYYPGGGFSIGVFCT
jgi:hypothetical protein